MTTPRVAQSIFPDYPRDPKIVDDKGQLTPYWDLGLSALFQSLQENYKNEGILLPSLSQTNIDDIELIYKPYIGQQLPQNIPDISGQTVFDTTNRISKQFIITYDTNGNVLSAKWYILNVMLISTYNPNGAGIGNPPIVGTLYSFCYDINGPVLYICTATPSTWTPV